MCVVLPKRSTVAVCDECKEHDCTECIDTHTCGTNVMMQLYCSRYLNNACRFYWRLMRLCYPNPPFSQLAKSVSNHLVWYRTGLRCSAAGKTLNNVVMTMRLCHGGVCEPSFRCLMALFRCSAASKTLNNVVMTMRL